MTIKVGDWVALKKDGRVEYESAATTRLFDLQGARTSATYFPILGNLVKTDTPYLVEFADGSPNIGLTVGRASVPVAKSQLDRVWANPATEKIRFRVGDVVSSHLGFNGVVEDYDPESDAQRALAVPVRVNFSTNRQVPADQVALVDPIYLKVEPKVTAAVKPILQDTLTPPAKKVLKDVTAEVTAAGDRSGWKQIIEGDVVTATHETQSLQGVPTKHTRTSTATRRGAYAYADADLYWCELNLSMNQNYDDHIIVKVEREVRSRTLEERRKPIPLLVTREVPADGIWSEGEVEASGPAYVEQNEQSGEYWLTFEKPGAPRVRLKPGRDAVEVPSKTGVGWSEHSVDYDKLVELTHEPE